MAANRSAIVSRASSQAIRSNRPSPFASDSLQGLKQPVRAVDPIEIAGHLLAEEPRVKRMIGIAPQLDRHAILNRHPHAARVGTIERADVLDHGQCGISRSRRHESALHSDGKTQAALHFILKCETGN